MVESAQERQRGRGAGRRLKTLADATAIFVPTSMGTGRHLQVQTTRIEIDPRVNPVRTRPMFADRPDRFEETQDYLTFASNVFWDADGETVHLSGPPRPAGMDVAFRALPGLVGCDAVQRPGTERSPDHYWVSVPSGTRALEVTFGSQRVIAAIQPNLCEFFAGRRALLAMSKNNDLQWIVDWAQFHAVHHGVDAVVLYDNGSTDYAMEDIARALEVVPGLAMFAVIPWPDPYGFGAEERFGSWAQRSALEDGWRRLLRDAEWVISADIDELLVPSPEATLDDVLARFRKPSVQFERVDVVSVHDDAQPVRRHLDFSWTAAGDGAKAVLRLAGLPDHVALSAHGIDQHMAKQWQRSSPALRFAHFLPLTTGWRRQERLSGTLADTPGLVDDAELRTALETALRNGPIAPRPWTALESPSAGLARLEADRLAAAGDLAGALTMIDHAIALEPTDPRHCAVRDRLRQRLAAG